jgi:hypothetical protein
MSDAPEPEPEPETDKISCDRLMPIDSAPRDGAVFLALDYLGYPHIVWGDDRGFFDEKDGDELKELKWWACIPPIPLDHPCV